MYTDDQLAIGDITSRHKNAGPHFIDHNLPLLGENSVYDKLLKVTLKDGTDLCASLRKDSVKSADSTAAVGELLIVNASLVALSLVALTIWKYVF